jgi:hypothetical protein
MADRLNKILETYVDGSRGYWFYDFDLAGVHISGGYFFRKRDAIRSIHDKLRPHLPTHAILLDYLKLKAKSNV